MPFVMAQRNSGGGNLVYPADLLRSAMECCNLRLQVLRSLQQMSGCRCGSGSCWASRPGSKEPQGKRWVLTNVLPPAARQARRAAAVKHPRSKICEVKRISCLELPCFNKTCKAFPTPISYGLIMHFDVDEHHDMYTHIYVYIYIYTHIYRMLQ